MSVRKAPSSGVKASASEGADYLSDVGNTHNSDGNYRSDSEASVDFILSARNLEQGFKYKYKVLKQAYEDRLMHLSQIVETSCHALITEEIGAEMKNDATTIAFLPSHLAEVFNSHLNDEREQYLHEVLTKLTACEGQLVKKNEQMDDSIAKIMKLETQISKYQHSQLELEPIQFKAMELEEKYNMLSRESKLVARENEKLLAELKETKILLDSHVSQKEQNNQTSILQQNQYSDLEKHCSRLEKELLRMGNVEEANEELYSKLKAVLQEKDNIKDEISEYRLQLKQAADELSKCQMVIDEHVAKEEANKVKINHLMSQVDIVISQEANESTAAIENAHNKIKLMRQHFVSELQEERAVSVSLDGQLRAARNELAERDRAIKIYEADLKLLKTKLNESKDDLANYERQLSSLSDSDKHLKSVNAELKLRNETLELRIHEMERTKAHEIAVISDQIRIQIQKQYEVEKAQLEMRTNTIRMQFENELNAMQSHFKRSRETFEALSSDMTSNENSSSANNDSNHVLANFIEQQKTQASEAIALIHHWQKAAIEANDENELLRKSIEKAGENIRILRRMLEEEKKKAHRLQETLDKSSALPNSGGVSAHSFNQSKILTAQNSSESIKNEPREDTLMLQSQIASLQQKINGLQNMNPLVDVNAMRDNSGRSQDLRERGGAVRVNYEAAAAHMTMPMDEPVDQDSSRYQSLIVGMQKSLMDKDATIQMLQSKLDELKQHGNAMHDRSNEAESVNNEAQLRALNDMKKRFQGLIDTYEASNTELEEELKEKIAANSILQVENEDLASKLQSQERMLARIKDECNAEKKLAHVRHQTILKLKRIIGNIEGKIKLEMDEIKRASLDIASLSNLLVSNSETEVKKMKALMRNAIENAFSDAEARQLMAVQNAQKSLHLQHRHHEEALSKAFTTELQLKSEQHTTEIEKTKSNLLSHFDRAMLFGPSQQNSAPDQQGLSSAENAHFTLVLSIKSVLDALVTMSLIDADFMTEIMQMISSSGDGMTNEYASPGLLVTKLNRMIISRLEKSLQQKETHNNYVTSLKNELDTKLTQIDNGNERISALLKENATLSKKYEDAKSSLEKFSKETATMRDLMVIEHDNDIQGMRDKLFNAQREYDTNVQNLRIDFIQKEAALKLKLDEALTKESNNSQTSLLESKLKAEVMKRQSLQNRLTAEEAAHRNIVQELEQRNSELLRNLEKFELEFTKLKLEKLHRYGDESMVSQQL